MTSDKNRPLIDRGTPPHWGGSDKNLPLNGKLGPPPPGGVYVTFPGPRGEGELDKCPALKRWGASCRQLGQLYIGNYNLTFLR